jgi:radical SAM/SPASM domain protein of ACGX system
MKQFFSFQWHITDECDQRCKHCYIFSGGDKKIECMNFPQMEKTLENCLDFCKTFDRIPHFYITGGDPILHENFWDLLSVLHQKEISFSILGNPFHLTDEICRRLKNSGCEKYQLSLDGLRETHDWFRKKGSFDATIEKIPLIKNAGIQCVIMSTVSDKNIDEIPSLMDFVVEKKADVFAFARFCPVNSGSNGISPERYRNFLHECDEKIRGYGENCETYFCKKDHLWTLYDFENKKFEIPRDAEKGMIYDGCNCGNCHLTILPSGDVLACRRIPSSKVGSVFCGKLSDLWLNQMEKFREFEKFEKCSQCELLAWCRGCPAVSYGTTGNFYGSDPQCWKKI